MIEFVLGILYRDIEKKELLFWSHFAPGSKMQF